MIRTQWVAVSDEMMVESLQEVPIFFRKSIMIIIKMIIFQYDPEAKAKCIMVHHPVSKTKESSLEQMTHEIYAHCFFLYQRIGAEGVCICWSILQRNILRRRALPWKDHTHRVLPEIAYDWISITRIHIDIYQDLACKTWSYRILLIELPGSL